MFEVIIIAISIAFFLVETYRWHYRFDILNRKPFSCMTCLSGWLSMGLCLWYGGTFIFSVFICFVAMMAASVFINLYKKYL